MTDEEDGRIAIADSKCPRCGGSGLDPQAMEVICKPCKGTGEARVGGGKGVRAVEVTAVAAMEATPAPVNPSSDEKERCDRCGWPLENDPKKGCVKGNCSQRPLPPLRSTGLGEKPLTEEECLCSECNCCAPGGRLRTRLEEVGESEPSLPCERMQG